MKNGDKVYVKANPSIWGYVDAELKSNNSSNAIIECLTIYGVVHERSNCRVWWRIDELALIKTMPSDFTPPFIPQEKYIRIPGRPSFP